jgi:hypothetical protein
MTAVNHASATIDDESLWPRLAGLPLVVEACEYDRLHAVFAYGCERITTHVRLVGAGFDGLGEDVSVFCENGTALHETLPALALEGEWTLARLLRPSRHDGAVVAAAGVERGAALSQLGVRVGGAGPRASATALGCATRSSHRRLSGRELCWGGA